MSIILQSAHTHGPVHRLRLSSHAREAHVACSRKRAADASDAAPSGAAAADGNAVDGAGEEEPLGARVAKLFPELQGGEASGGAAAGEPITADSLTVLLTQAIQSGDKVRRDVFVDTAVYFTCMSGLHRVRRSALGACMNRKCSSVHAVGVRCGLDTGYAC